jgi:hypothetical protein
VRVVGSTQEQKPLQGGRNGGERAIHTKFREPGHGPTPPLCLAGFAPSQTGEDVVIDVGMASERLVRVL